MDRVAFGHMLEMARTRSQIDLIWLTKALQTNKRNVLDLELGRRDCQAERCFRYLEAIRYALLLTKKGRKHKLPTYQHFVSWINRRQWQDARAPYARRLGVDQSNLMDIMNRKSGMRMSTMFKIAETLGYEIKLIPNYGRKVYADERS